MYKWYKINNVSYYFNSFICNYDFTLISKAERGYQFGTTRGINSIFGFIVFYLAWDLDGI